jgi:uracil-DNA glycosylase family 4
VTPVSSEGSKQYKAVDLVRTALRQQLEADRLFGLSVVPMTMPVSAAVQAGARKREQLDLIDETQVRNCTKCSLSETRTKTVFGQGNEDARLVFVGEAPGADEDRQGLAFVGRAGQLLTRMIAAMGLSRDDVFICNVLKCRPPNNRDPLADEVLACSPYLREQLRIIDPEVVVTLGAPASKTLLNTVQSIGKLRGRFHEYWLSGVEGMGPCIPLMPTYHPAYLLRNESEKRKAWEDLQQVMHKLGLQPAKR